MCVTSGTRPFEMYRSAVKTTLSFGRSEGIAAEIEHANAQLARVEQIKKFRVIPKELDPEEGDTTPTRKVKRRHMYELFKELVEDMYRDEKEARIA